MQRILICALATAITAATQQPPITNPNSQMVSAAGGLEAAVRAAIRKRRTWLRS